MSRDRPIIDVTTATARHQLVLTRTLDAPPDRVFDAFTDPEQLMKWWWPKGFKCPYAEVDLRVGGAYKLTMEWPDFIAADDQFAHYMAGEYIEIDRPYRLVMSGRAISVEQGELFATLIEVTLVENGASTELTVRQSFFEPMPPTAAMGGAEQGWSEQLDKLATLLIG